MAETAKETTPLPISLKGDLMRGVEEIAAFWCMTPSQTFYALSHGHIPGFKVGATWCARRSTSLEELRRLEKRGAA